jgi:hypothetical protein
LSTSKDNCALDHDLHDTAQGVRFTISESARREVLDRLLALNHRRNEMEVKAGLHNKKKAKKKKWHKGPGSPRGKMDNSQMKLF